MLPNFPKSSEGHSHRILFSYCEDGKLQTREWKEAGMQTYMPSPRNYMSGVMELLM